MTSTTSMAPSGTPSAALAPSGDLTGIANVVGRSYVVQRHTASGWGDMGRLDLFADTGFLDNRKLHNVFAHPPTNSVNFSFRKDGDHRSGTLFMTEDGGAFVGTITSGQETFTVRGHNTSALFETSRKPQGSAPTSAPWKTLEIGTDWSDDPAGQRLKAFYRLGGDDITARTAVTSVDSWKTTIEMVRDSNPLGASDSFEIVVDFQGNRFSGTYTDEDGTPWNWTGEVQPASAQSRAAHASAFVHLDEPTDGQALHPRIMTPRLRLAETGPSLSVGDLLTVSSIYAATDTEGKSVTLDTAQVQTGKYFQSLLINSLPAPWLGDFFGSPDSVPPAVDALRIDDADWYAKKSVMNLGQMIHGAFRTDPTNKDIVAKIDLDKIADGWTALGKDATYLDQSSKLYVEGYRTGVPGIAPYLDDSKRWANELFDTLMSDDFLNMWAVQVASVQFKNVREQMYQWSVQLQVLDPEDADKPKRMLETMYGVVLKAQFNNATWIGEMKPFLAEIIDNVLKGDPDALRSDQMLSSNFAEIKADLQSIVTAYGDSVKFADDFAEAMSLMARTMPNMRIVNIAQGAWANFAAQYPKLSAFASTGSKIMGALAFGAGAGFIIYSLATGDKRTTPKSLVTDINLGVLVTALLVKSIEKLFSTAIGNWFRSPAAAGESRFVTALRGFGGWFTEAGVTEGTWVAKVFGKNSADFFAYRLGPALALFAIVMSAWDLADDIKSGNFTAEIFDAINVALSVAGLVFLGLEMASFAWAGPVGLVIAAAGLIVALVQLIWEIKHPHPQPNPVKDFVNGPLKAAGFVTA